MKNENIDAILVAFSCR